VPKFEIDLNLPDVKLLSIETTKTKDLVITVKSTKRSTKCHKCGKEITQRMDPAVCAAGIRQWGFFIKSSSIMWS
jgi:hypothetical protein